jgi:hypothetical protein
MEYQTASSNKVRHALIKNGHDPKFADFLQLCHDTAATSDFAQCHKNSDEEFMHQFENNI